MPLEPGPEDIWRSALRQARQALQASEECGWGAREVSRERRRVQRIWDQGRPEWQAPGRHNKMPLPQPVETPE